MLRRTLIPLAVALGLGLPAAAAAKSYTATDHSLRATIAGNGTVIHPAAPTLTITDQGSSGVPTLYHGAVTNRACGTGCMVSTAPADPPLRFAPLDGRGSADLLVNLYSGGANCCTLLDLFRSSAALNGLYVLSASHNFTYAGYRLEKIGSRYVFVTADPSFETVFTDFAASGLPLQILRLSGVKFLDVTSSYPTLLRRDAARWLVAYRRTKGSNDVGLIAAWAADEAGLGRWNSAHAYLVSQARAGRLRSTLFPHTESGLRFVSQLETLMRREGYLNP
jgi:hypothetical protein